jgi:hypothetical protein
MKNILTTVICFLFLGITSQAYASAPDQKTKKYKVANFQSLELGNAFEIHITKGSSCSVTATGNEQDLEDVEVQLEGSRLHVSLDESYWSSWKNWKGGSNKIIINISMPRLRDAEFNGASKVTLEGFTDEEEMTLHCSGASKLTSTKLVADKLVIDLSGATKVEMAGQVLKLSVNLSGASHVNLSNMVTRDVDVEASGASHVELNVQKSLRVDASGASKISYRGNPLNISKDLSGASTVRRAD